MDVTEHSGDFAGEGGVPGRGDIIKGGVSFGREFRGVATADVEPNGCYFSER